MYLYMPRLGLWTSHPFTVAWSSTDESSLSLNEKRSSSDSFAALNGKADKTTMSILIKGQDGFTKKLLEKAERSPEGRITAMALAEGPFGTYHADIFVSFVDVASRGISFTKFLRVSSFDCWRHWDNSPIVLHT